MMEQWMKLSIWIGLFGFFKEFRPEDPYIIQYMTGPKMNFTDEQVNQVIFPVSTYTSMIELVFVFLITDWLRYKPVVVVCAVSGVIVQALLIWGRGVRVMQIMEVFYGTMGSTEVAYYTYIYAKVDPQYFQQVTSYMRGAVLSGRFLSSIVSQVFLIGHIMDISQLNYLTLIGMLCAFVWALGLPSVPRSLYFHRDGLPTSIGNGIANGTVKPPPDEIQSYGSAVSPSLGTETPKKVPSSLSYGLNFLWEDFKFAFTKPYVLKWCMWVALSTCCYLQVMAYVQILWQLVATSGDDTFNIIGFQPLDMASADGSGDKPTLITQYNGAVEAVYTLISATASVLFGKLALNWKTHGDSMLGIFTIIGGVLITLSAYATSVWFCFVVYIIFGTLYHVQMTVAYSEIAKHIKPDSYALVFGVNSFASLIIQTVLVFTVASDSVLALPIRTQFVVYGLLSVSLGGFFLIKAVFKYMQLFLSTSTDS